MVLFTGLFISKPKFLCELRHLAYVIKVKSKSYGKKTKSLINLSTGFVSLRGESSVTQTHR